MTAAAVAVPARDAELYQVLEIAGAIERRLRVNPPSERELAVALTIAAVKLREYARRWWRLELLLEAKNAEERAELLERFRESEAAPHSGLRAVVATSATDPCSCGHSRGDHARNSRECLDDECNCEGFSLDVRTRRG